MTYDALCRPLRADYPLGGYTVRSLVGLGNPAGQYTRTDAPPPPGVTGSSWTETYFDGLGRPWKTLSRGPSGGDDIVVEQRYGPRGLLVEATEPRYLSEAERVTSYAYDELGRVVRVELPGAREVTTSYEATSQTVTDPDGRTTTSRFDAYGRVIEVERTLNSQPVVTETSYDLLGRHIGMTDPAGAQWTWAYDSLGRLREEWDPDAGHRVYSYDKAGRPLTQTDAKGQTTTLAYDAPVGRLATRTNASGTVSFTYGQARSGFFNLGRLTQVSSPADVLQIDYDAEGRVVEQRRTFESVTYTVEKELDPSGYLLATTYPDGDVVGGLGYDGAGRLASIPGVVTAISYDALGRSLSRQHTNTTQTTWSYADPRGFLSRIQTSGAQGTVQDLQYTQYSDAGLLQQVTSPISGEGWSYAYDELGHMTTATHLQDSAQSQSFTFDGADRILTSSRYGTYAYPTPGQPRPHAPTSVNGTPLSYDLNGNVTQAGTRSLVWNADDRPVQATLGGVATSFSYAGAGERLKKTSSYGTSLYPFGDDYEITNGVVTKYISVEGLGVVAKRVGYGASAVTYFVHTDRLGSIQAVTSDGSDSQYPAGTVVSRRTYRPFGETLAQSGPHAESRGWIDQRNDPETGLTYLHARYFDPQLGVFISPDPSEAGAMGVGVNRYGYGLGSPVNLIDRGGLAASQCSFEGRWNSWTQTWVEDVRCSAGGGAPSLMDSLHQSFVQLVHNLFTPRAPDDNGRSGGQRNPAPACKSGDADCRQPAPTCKQGDAACEEPSPHPSSTTPDGPPPPTCGGPDYFSGNAVFQLPFVSAALAAIPAIGEGLAATVGASVQLTIDRGGNLYLGLGPSFGVPASGFNLQAGRMLKGPNPASRIPAPPSQRTPSELSAHISGHSINWNGTLGLSLGHTTGLTEGSAAMFGEVGVGSRGTSVAYHYTVPLFTTSLGWGDCR